MKPSPQQEAFYNWVQSPSGSCVLEAVAGAGKTTTLIHSLNLMSGDVFFGAYNKAIADEIQSRVPRNRNARINVSTFHAAGLRSWRRLASGVKVDGNKCRDIFRSTVGKNPQNRDFESSTLKLVSLAKQSGIGSILDDDDEEWNHLVDHFDIECPDQDTPRLIQFAWGVLEESVKTSIDIVDFDDMIYMPLYRELDVGQYDWVLVDEAQDTNATRRELALRMLKPNGRLVAVGDPRQAIYGFTGADSDALDRIADSVSAVRMPLTVTYRCPKAVVDYAKAWVNHITAADSAPEGEVLSAPQEDLAKVAQPGDAVLCRFNAPLVKHVYAFIAAGVPAKIEGRDIGQGLKELAARWKEPNLARLDEKVLRYMESECQKLRNKDKESQASALEDRVQCLRVIIQRLMQKGPGVTADDIPVEIDSIFGSTENRRDVVTFSSIHKSKGREWHKVVWLQTPPSPYARKPWQQEQETNLCYVAATRAKATLINIQI